MHCLIMTSATTAVVLVVAGFNPPVATDPIPPAPSTAGSTRKRLHRISLRRLEAEGFATDAGGRGPPDCTQFAQRFQSKRTFPVK
jgi:hypothetical protein